MSLADDVLARHVEAFCNLCEPTHSRGTCRVCFTEAWPCEAVRLATQLRAADIAIESLKLHKPGYCKACNEALAEYDKGGQG